MRRISRGLNKMISRSVVHYNLMNAKKRIHELMTKERKVRKLIAMDETKIKMNGEEYYIYSAIDVERNEIIAMKGFYHKKLFDNTAFCERSFESMQE